MHQLKPISGEVVSHFVWGCYNHTLDVLHAEFTCQLAQSEVLSSVMKFVHTLCTKCSLYTV